MLNILHYIGVEYVLHYVGVAILALIVLRILFTPPAVFFATLFLGYWLQPDWGEFALIPYWIFFGVIAITMTVSACNIADCIEEKNRTRGQKKRTAWRQ